ncbi:MAG: flagellar basal body L-ring protein FlgH [Gemmatimonadetes bacterium]|nr:MAG: flagellar basal body L-ring protein FlgH [Gemmatimonadota bacterium]
MTSAASRATLAAVLTAVGGVLAVPQAVGAQQQTGAAAAGARPASVVPTRTSWFADRRDVRVGDVVTILVDELTLAQANVNQSAQKDRSSDFGFNSNGSGTSLGFQNDAARRQRGESTSRNRFSAEISGRVVEVTPGGMARVEGLKKLKIDEHELEVVIRGWVRAQDISTRNTVDSWRMADAEILYTSNGELGKASKGFLAKLFDIILP